jgi:hypothetical protein
MRRDGGLGLTQQPNLMPVDAGKIVLRARKEDAEESA